MHASSRPSPLTVALLAVAATSALAALAATAHAGGSEYKMRSGYQSYSYYGRSDADMVVRPDVLTISFDLKKTSDDPEAALAAVQAIAEELTKRYQGVSPDAAVHMNNLTIEPAGEKQKPDMRNVTVEGSIELPLGAEVDYWKRAHLLTQLVQVSKSVVDEQKDAKKSVLAHVGRPQALVRNPEAFRGELIKLWIDHVRSFSSAAQSVAAPLEVMQCDPPTRVQQHTISLEEVGVSLHLNCRLDVPRK